tara:strand:- start:664 stop:906 length:243 start_codon:yes stop_codon:yes gene_type:complete
LTGFRLLWRKRLNAICIPAKALKKLRRMIAGIHAQFSDLDSLSIMGWRWKLPCKTLEYFLDGQKIQTCLAITREHFLKIG